MDQVQKMMTNNPWKLFVVPLLSVAIWLASISNASADGSENKGSEKISMGTMSILQSPIESVNGMSRGEPSAGLYFSTVGTAFIVSGIVQSAGDSVEVILDAVGNAGKFSVKLSNTAAKSLALSVGTSVNVVSEATGTVLVASGKVIAFIPNELGKALLSQRRLSAN